METSVNMDIIVKEFIDLAQLMISFFFKVIIMMILILLTVKYLKFFAIFQFDY